MGRFISKTPSITFRRATSIILSRVNSRGRADAILVNLKGHTHVEAAIFAGIHVWVLHADYPMVKFLGHNTLLTAKRMV